MKRKFRILKNNEYSDMAKKCKFIKDKYFVVYYKNKKLKNARVGISVSKKIGIAVTRNKIKRQINGILQTNINFTSFPKDFTIYPRQQYKKDDFNKMKDILLVILKKIGK